MSFEKWFQEVKKVASDRGFVPSAIESFSEADWKGYFEDGYTPEDAVNEDCSYD